MLWLCLSLITAFAVACRDVSVKAFADLTPSEVAMLELFWALPLFGAGCLLVEVPPLDVTFWWTFLVSLPLNMVAYLLYLYAIKSSPLTLSVPFLAFTPVLMILTGAIILDEAVSFWGGAGIGLIVFGSYVLNFKRADSGLLQPFVALCREKGSWLMLVVAFLFSFAAVIGKKAILHSSPLFFVFFFFLVFNTATLLLLALAGRWSWQQLLRKRWQGIWLGVLLVLHVGSHGLAIALANAVYMVAVKRSSIVFSVILSWIFLHEEQAVIRGLGTLFMFAGVLLITFLG
jgi:drug/metabolite transporter (DMT)-like permease